MKSGVTKDEFFREKEERTSNLSTGEESKDLDTTESKYTRKIKHTLSLKSMMTRYSMSRKSVMTKSTMSDLEMGIFTSMNPF